MGGYTSYSTPREPDMKIITIVPVGIHRRKGLELDIIFPNGEKIVNTIRIVVTNAHANATWSELAKIVSCVVLPA